MRKPGEKRWEAKQTAGIKPLPIVTNVVVETVEDGEKLSAGQWRATILILFCPSHAAPFW